MRSQSSAQNLRKVHEKKEEVKREGGPTSGLAGEPIMTAESPSSTESQDAEPSNTQERSEHIMNQMFPKGVDHERARLFAAQQYFPSDQSQAGTAATTPVDRTVPETVTENSVEPEKARDDTPQQRDEVMVDRPVEGTIMVKSTTAPVASMRSHTIQEETQAAPVPASTSAAPKEVPASASTASFDTAQPS
jgi:hypothetical protein